MDGLAIICALIVFFLPIYQDYKKTARMVRRSENKILCIRARNIFLPNLRQDMACHADPLPDG